MCQSDFILKDNTPITMYRFQHVFDVLMRRDWAIEVTPNNYRVFNLAKAGWTWGYHHKKRALGTASYNRMKGVGKVMISKKFLELNLDKNPKDFEDTIRHEIAHAIDYMIRDKSGHDARWKAIAVQVGAAPTRTAKGKEFDSPDYKWTGKCDKGHSHARHKLTTRGKSASCGICCNRYNGGRYSPDYPIHWTKNW